MPEVVHLTAGDLVLIAAPATGAPGVVRDYGLLDAAANRPRASAFGQDAYPSLHLKAAALLQSLLMNHPLVDGNKRLAWLATVVFYDLNGHELDAPTGEAFDFVLSVVTEHLDVDAIGAQLEKWAGGR
ncbi:MAG TPA: type II toxin-antitoxin system death-on-curing family toxin [Acidimicrobiales bacterium]|nr:type II toxin-antitoxin system death-on-curing family toxin [Acidimicrobiales bacterium]